MEIFDSILGNAADAEWKARLEGAQVDWLELSQWDAQKNRFRRKTAGGRSMAVALGLGCSAAHGIFPVQGSNWRPLHRWADS